MIAPYAQHTVLREAVDRRIQVATAIRDIPHAKASRKGPGMAGAVFEHPCELFVFGVHVAQDQHPPA